MLRFRLRQLFFFCFGFVFLISCNRMEINEPYSISLENAVKYFEEGVCQASTKCSGENKVGAFYLGDIIPEWSNYNINRNNVASLENIETAISTTYKYRVFQKDGKRSRYTNCYQKLVVSEDMVGDSHGVSVVFFIPTNDYDWGHKKNIDRKFGNDGNMRDYSGLKLYCTLEGKIYRINQYKDGNKIGGIFFPEIKTDEQLEYAIDCLNGWFGNMTFQRGEKITRSVNSLDVESDGYVYNDMGQNIELTPSICSDTSQGYARNADMLRNMYNDLLVLYICEDAPIFDQDDSSGGDGPGEAAESGETITVKIGGYELTIECINLADGDLKNLKDQLSKLSALPVVQRLIGLIFDSGIKLNITACGKEGMKNIKFFDGYNTYASGVSKAQWKSGKYDSVNIYLNATDGTSVGYLEELYHAFQYGGATQRISYIWDFEFEAKAFLGSIIGTGISSTEFNTNVSGNLDFYYNIYSYTRLAGVSSYREAAITAMQALGYYSNSGNCESAYFNNPYLTPEEKAAADEWARKMYEKIIELFQ